MAESHKRNHSVDGSKDVKVFPSKDMHATHMLGNQLNPSSSVAQKMSDQLFMEMEAHSVYTSSSMDSNTQMMGPVFPGKQLNNVCNECSCVIVKIEYSNEIFLFAGTKYCFKSTARSVAQFNVGWHWTTNGTWKHTTKS